MSLSFDLPGLRRRDLRQVVTLLALLRACSVTEAARQLDVSQPSVSKVLEHLRRDFGDPLLVREGNRMRRTPKAEDLMPRLEAALRGLDEVLTKPGQFDPATVSRKVRIGANDHLQHMLAARLFGIVRERAPGVHLQFRPVGMYRIEHLLNEGLADILIGGPAGIENLHIRHSPLFTEEFVCVASPRYGASRMDFQTFCETPQVDISPSGIGLIPAILDRAVADRGGQRKVVGTLSTFAAVPEVVAGHELIAVVPRGAISLFRPASVRVVELDLPLPPYQVSLWWHNNTNADPLARWLREQISQSARASLADGLPNSEAQE